MLRTQCRIGVLAAVAGLLWAGCSFKTGLEDYRCDNPGDRRGNRVCSDGGFWVALDTGRADAGPDGEAGTCSPTADTEKCDGKFAGNDDDCNGVVDEGCPCRFRGKTSGVCADARRNDAGNCERPDEYVEPVDDETPLCDDRDNDCDGSVDEGCAGCEPGETRKCFPSNDDLAGTGICEKGDQECREDATWGACKGANVPRESESCGEEGASEDANCNGANLDGCACDYGGQKLGVCEGRGTIDEDDECTIPPDDYVEFEENSDLCDDLDNDCDGAVDEECPCNYDGKSAGVCGEATVGRDGECGEPDGYVSDDEEDKDDYCDGKDSDCDGAVDDDGRCPCKFKPKGSSDPVSQGVCGDATYNEVGECTAPNFEMSEQSCDDEEDNDCDGDIDYEDVDCKETALSTCEDDEECLSGKCHKGECAHLIVATSHQTDGDLGGLQGADRLCNNRVGDEIPGDWRAVLSDGQTSAESRVSVNSDVYNTNGDKIAKEGELWDRSVESAIRYDEYGREQATREVWTGTRGDGTIDGSNCGGWKSNAGSDQGHVGASGQTNQKWLDDSDVACDNSLSVYCIDGQ